VRAIGRAPPGAAFLSRRIRRALRPGRRKRAIKRLSLVEKQNLRSERRVSEALVQAFDSKPSSVRLDVRAST